jgi:hypothetical protein
MSYTPEQCRLWADCLKRGELHDVYRAHAAALEENAKLRKHAKEMADELERLEEFHPYMSAYRADFPKEPR